MKPEWGKKGGGSSCKLGTACSVVDRPCKPRRLIRTPPTTPALTPFAARFNPAPLRFNAPCFPYCRGAYGLSCPLCCSLVKSSPSRYPSSDTPTLSYSFSSLHLRYTLFVLLWPRQRATYNGLSEPPFCLLLRTSHTHTHMRAHAGQMISALLTLRFRFSFLRYFDAFHSFCWLFFFMWIYRMEYATIEVYFT